MNLNNIIKLWRFPKSTIINRNLPKVHIYPHLKKTKDKDFVQNNVQSIYVLANLRTENTRIPTFESEGELYQEVQFLYIKTKEYGDSEKIFTLLSNLIPYPLVVLIEEEANYIIFTGRYEKLSTNYLRLSKPYYSPSYKEDELEDILKKLEVSNLPKQNLKVFYDQIRDIISTEQVTGQFKELSRNITSEEKDKIDMLSDKINDLSKSVAKERQLNRKIEKQMELKKLKDALSKILNNQEGKEL